MKKALVVGSGAREHALAWKLRSEGWSILSAPGNPGLMSLGPCYPVKGTDLPGLRELARRESVALVLVGPEQPLTMGLADALRRDDIPVFGPDANAARIEGSKIYAKELMRECGVPTANFFTFEDAANTRRFLDRPDFGYPLVVKADGLAAGKGVIVARNRDEAVDAVDGMMVQGRYGDAGRRIVIEECLAGPEISFFALSHGADAVALGSAQDYKRLLDGDAGPNTGGMGSVSPSPLMTPDLSSRIMRTIIEPTLAGLARSGFEYRGLLYAGLMMTSRGPMVLEFNCRFGDPETQPLMLTLGDGFGDALLDAARGRRPTAPEIRDARAVCVVLASRGYPEQPESGKLIRGVDRELPPGVVVFHAGTTMRDSELVTAGGRVLSVCAAGATYEEARHAAYESAGWIAFEGVHYRRDIARF